MAPGAEGALVGYEGPIGGGHGGNSVNIYRAICSWQLVLNWVEGCVLKMGLRVDMLDLNGGKCAARAWLCRHMYIIRNVITKI